MHLQNDKYLALWFPRGPSFFILETNLSIAIRQQEKYMILCIAVPTRIIGIVTECLLTKIGQMHKSCMPRVLEFYRAKRPKVKRSIDICMI